MATPVPVASAMEISHVFLATAFVMVQDKNGKQQQCRAILDSEYQLLKSTSFLRNS